MILIWGMSDDGATTRRHQTAIPVQCVCCARLHGDYCCRAAADIRERVFHAVWRYDCVASRHGGFIVAQPGLQRTFLDQDALFMARVYVEVYLAAGRDGDLAHCNGCGSQVGPGKRLRLVPRQLLHGYVSSTDYRHASSLWFVLGRFVLGVTCPWASGSSIT